MILKQLLTAVEVLTVRAPLGALEETTISSLCFDSRQATPDALFFALPGLHHQGLTFAQEAINRGAVAIVTEEELLFSTKHQQSTNHHFVDSSTKPIPLIRVADARKAMAALAASFYNHPSQGLSVCGVTGTNGKTTTSYLVRHLCNTSGRPCGLLGTVEYILPGKVEEAARTTPESIPIQQMLDEMLQGGFKAVAMEVASHAIVQQRVANIEFDVALFTNLTQDHLDYHKTMEAYFEAKAGLFESLAQQEKKKGRAVINADDRYGRMLIERFSSKLKIITFGQSSNVDFRASDIRYSAKGTIFCLDARGRSYLVRSPLIGVFNVYNALGALTAAASMGLELRRVIKALESAPQVPGRLQRVSEKKNFQVFVDYAHTPDALENVLRSLKQLEPRRLVVVFGCGGDRDRAKRPLMAAAAEAHADVLFVTSDNPRSEDPSAIIAETVRGLRQQKHQVIPDRAQAIARAIEQALPHDIIVIAGKGHEKYQEINGACLPFDDVLVAERALRNKIEVKN
jgi:UDP-N-acetylmuramoyl-L-alanyl-D-glutamate--2,6-diaminopimelate ligase